MSSMYKDYVEEQLPNRFVLENEVGFITYSILGEECNLEEIYIVPECRRQGAASKMYNVMADIAHKIGCTHLKGTIIIGTNNAEISMKCLFKNGFELSDTNGVMIHLTRKV